MKNFQQISKDESQSQISKNVEEPKRFAANVQDNLYQQSQSDSLTSNQNGIVALQKAYGNRLIQRMYSDSQVSDEEASWNYHSVDDFQEHIPEDSDEQLAQRVEKAIGTGNQLDSDVLGDLESGLGVNLTNLRIHQDAEADSLAHSFKAAAFTTGSDIFFRHGTFNPRTENGFRLLAHETAHVVQQRDSSLAISENSGPLTISEPSDQFEQEADAAAEKIVAGQTADLQPRQTSTVSRLDDDESWWNSTIGNVAGAVGLGNDLRATPSNAIGGITSVLGLATGGLGMYDAATRPGTFGLDDLSDFGASGLSAFGGLTGTLSSLGVSSLAAGGEAGLAAIAGGSGALGSAGAYGTAGAALGSAGAVAGAGAAGYGIGRLLDEGFGGLMNITGASAAIDEARGVSRPKGQSGDYSLSGIGGDLAYAADSAVTGGLRSLGVFDEDEPAYTQTLGWQLAEILPSWLQ